MIRTLLSALTATALLVLPATAEEKDKDKDKGLTGTFSKTAGDYTLTFEFKKGNTFNFKMTNGNDGFDTDCKFTREKDGTLKIEVQKFEKMGNFPKEVEKGYKFSFKVKKEGKKITISDIEGDGIDDEAKNVLGGEYEEK